MLPQCHAIVSVWTHSCQSDVHFLQHLKWRRSESGAKSSSNICRSSSIISHSGAPLQEDIWKNSKTSSWTVPTQRASHMMYTHIHVTTTQAFTHMYTESRAVWKIWTWCYEACVLQMMAGALKHKCINAQAQSWNSLFHLSRSQLRSNHLKG